MCKVTSMPQTRLARVHFPDLNCDDDSIDTQVDTARFDDDADARVTPLNGDEAPQIGRYILDLWL